MGDGSVVAPDLDENGGWRQQGAQEGDLDGRVAATFLRVGLVLGKSGRRANNSA